MKLCVQRFLLFNLLCIICCFAEAALYVDVNKSNVHTINLSVSAYSCKTSNEDDFKEKVSKTIEEDLLNCGLFNIKHELITDAAESIFRHEKKSDVLAIIGVNETLEKKMELSLQLFDAFTKKELHRQSMTFPTTNWKEVGHLISDAIHYKLIGTTGHFNTKITYVAEEKDKNNKSVRKIAVMNQDGSNVRYLTDGNEFVSTPRFSPDGQKIAYISYADGASYVVLKNLQDNTESFVKAFDDVVSSPRFSPDGKILLISHSSGGETNILSLDLNNGYLKTITKNSAINTSPSFSPDQKYVVFSSDISGSRQLYIVDSSAKEKKSKRISSDEGQYSTPVWSPSGNLIAFTKSLSGKFYVGTMKPDGTGERLLLKGDKIESPAWLPNGKEVIFTKTDSLNNSKLYLMDTIKKKLTLVATPTNAFLPDCCNSLLYIDNATLRQLM